MLAVHIDFDRDGDYDTPEEDVSDRVLALNWSLGQPAPFRDDVAPDGTPTVTLDNHDRRFSPSNDDSPLNGILLAGRRVRISYDGNPLWTGWIRRVELAPGSTGSRLARVDCAQGGYLLAAHRPSLTPQLNQTADTLISTVLGQVLASPAAMGQWIVDGSTLDSSTRIYDPSSQLDSTAGQTVFPYVGDVWDDGTSTLTIIRQLMLAEQGQFYQGRDGRFVFRNRHAPLTDFTTPIAVDIDTDTVRAHHRYGDNFTNSVSVTTYPRSVNTTPTVVWSSQAPLRVNAGKTQSFLLRVDDIVTAVLSLETPLPGSDYTAAGEFGRDRTTGIVLTAALDSGNTARVTIINPLTFPVFVTLQLRGSTITLFDGITVEAVDYARLVSLGRFPKVLNLRLLSDTEAARELAEWLLFRDNNPGDSMQSLTLHAGATGNIDRITAWTIGTRLQIADAQTASDNTYRIIGEDSRYTADDGWLMTYVVQRVDDSGYMVLDSSGTLGKAVVGY